MSTTWHTDYHPVHGRYTEPPRGIGSDAIVWLKGYTASMQPLTIRWGKLAYAAILGAYFIYCAWTPLTWHIIDGANLLIHEAGHVVCSIFGDFIRVLGGTIFQLAVPTMFALYFWWKLQLVDACVMLMWLGESTLNVSVYAADAVKQQLPLLSGDTANHDWAYLLSHLDLLDQTAKISGAIRVLGIAILILGIAGALYRSIFNRDAPGKLLT